MDDNGCRCLVVDDNAETRHLIIAILALRGIDHYDEARDGIEALHKIANHHYVLILLDLGIRNGSGFDLLYSFRAFEDGLAGPHPHLPDVIALTALTEDDLPDERLIAVAPRSIKAIVRKPIEVGTLSRLVAPYASLRAAAIAIP